jgi:hypothetical protein
MLDRAEQVYERAPEPVDCPRHHNIELPAARVLEQLIETRTLRTPLGTADAGVDEISTTCRPRRSAICLSSRI